MEKIELNRGNRILLLVTLVSLALTLLVSGSVFADTVGPVYSDVFPAENSVLVSGSLTLQFTAADQDYIDAFSLVMKVDGIRVMPIIEFGWIEEWTEDYSTLHIYYPGTFSNGIHSVEVSLKDRAGNASLKQWSFKVGQPAQITDISPPDDAVVTETRPVISAVIKSGAAIDPGSVVMTVDGTRVPAYFDPMAGRVTYVPADDLADESLHAVTLAANDLSGSAVSVQWQFKVNTYTEMSFTVNDATCQKCHPRISHPMNNCGSCHGQNLDEDNPAYPIDDCYRCHFNVDSYPASYHDNGLPVANPPEHPVRITDSCVECHAAAWDSGIPSYHNIADTSERHLSSATSCVTCHARSLTREHQKHKDSNGNTLTCYTCHDNPDTKIQSAINTGDSSCSACHNLGSDGGHPAHNNGLDVNCQTCHSGSVLTEEVFHRKNGCGVCHSDTAPDMVKYSISTDNTNCFSCHNQGHNVNFVQMVPADIPLYPGFTWTVPQDASIWSEEPWFNAVYDTIGAKIIISDRLQSVSGVQVYDWYVQNMAAAGWVKTEGPDQGSDNFAITFTKGNRMASVTFYGGEYHNPASPFLGYRLEILYK